VYELNKEITFTGASGSTVFKHSYLTEPTEEGTKLTLGMEMMPKGFARPAEPLIASSLRRAFVAGVGEPRTCSKTE
jgi:hypothetical protein